MKTDCSRRDLNICRSVDVLEMKVEVCCSLEIAATCEKQRGIREKQKNTTQLSRYHLNGKKMMQAAVWMKM